MDRVRSSMDKPPLALSPRRLRPRRTLRSDAPPAAPQSPPAPPPKEILQRSPQVVKPQQISQEINNLDTDASENFASIAKLAAAPRIPTLKRGRMYDLYSARRNERLKRKMEESFEEIPPRRSIALADPNPRKSVKRTENVRQSLPQDFISGASSVLRSSTTTFRSRNGSSSVLRSSMKLKIDAEKPLYLRSSIRK